MSYMDRVAAGVGLPYSSVAPSAPDAGPDLDSRPSAKGPVIHTALSRCHTIALVRAMILPMGGISFHDSPQLGTAALMHSPLRQSAIPVIAILALAGLAGCLAYFIVAPAPISQSATFAAHSAKEALPTVGQAQSAEALTVVDRQRPRDKDIANAFRQAADARQAVEVREAAADTYKPAIAGPIPLPRRRPTPR